MAHDYYKILGVTKNATDDDIKKAYRKLAHKYHPDKAQGDEKKFKEINEAYQILSNKERRAQYDRFGQTFNGTGGPGFGGQGPQGFGFDFGFEGGGMNPEDLSNLNDIFDSIFEGMGVKKKRRTYQHGSDLELGQEITLEEAYKGLERKVVFKTFIPCTKCEGVGHFEKEGHATCATCDGRGEVQEARKSFFGNFTQVRACERCNGEGKIPNKLCESCSGNGRKLAEKSVQIAIAPGVQDNQFIKISSAGEVGERGAGAGDLYVHIKIKPHKTFVRKGDELIMKKEVSLTDVLLEKELHITTISGEKKTVEIPEGFNLRHPVKITGAGMPRLGTQSYGDLYVTLDVTTPKKLSTKAKKILEELKREVEGKR